MRGSAEKHVLANEEALRSFAQRRVQATAPIRRGEKLQEGRNVAALRPGVQRSGVHPQHLNALEGRAATRDIPLGDGIQADDWE
jgi:sialic acid synthase SpsE